MKKIAILNCLKANENCTGASCLKAFNSKTQHFALYQKEPVELVAFMRCNGCKKPFATNEGMQEKLQRLIKEQVSIVHLGLCTQLKVSNNPLRQECPEITRIAHYLEKNGLQVIRGTHY